MVAVFPLLALALAPASLVQAKSSSFLSHAHKVAVKHSAGLARDLRVAFGNVLATQSTSSSNENVYCVSSNGIGVSVPASANHSSSSTSPTSTAAGTAAPSSSSVASSPWKAVQNYSGQTFFNGWDFFTTADPTNGNVQYVDQATAQSAGLLEINSNGNAVMRVETTPQVQSNRKSVRITTQATFNGGLVVMDAVHMPTGCATWPGMQQHDSPLYRTLLIYGRWFSLLDEWP